MIDGNESESARLFIAQIIKGSLLVSFGTIIYTLCNFLFKFFLLRNWTPDEYGIFTLVLTIVGVVGVFAEFSLNTSATVFIARKGESKDRLRVISAVSVSYVLLVTCSFLATFVIVFLLPSEYAALQIFKQHFGLIWILIFVTGLAAISYGIARGYKRLSFEAAAKAGSGFAMVGVLALLLASLSRFGIEASLGILVISQAVVPLIVVILFARTLTRSNEIGLVKRGLNYVGTLKFPDILGVLRFSFFMSGLGVLGIILSSIDKLIIPAVLSTEMLGFYSGAYFIVSIPKVITGSVATTIQPYVSERSHNLRDAKRVYLAFLSMIAVIAIVGYGAMIVFAGETLFLLPSEYSWIAHVVQILLVGMLLSDVFLFNATFISSLRLTKGIRQLILAMFTAVLINIALNLVLIPRLGIEGAAYAATVSFAFLAAASILQVMFVEKLGATMA